MIKTKIYSNKIHIGTGLLRNTLGGMGTMYGRFLPNENYHLVKQVVQEWNNSRGDDFHRKWRELRFNAQLESGFFLFAIGHFGIDDFKEYPEEPQDLSLAGVLSCVFNRDAEPDNFTVTEKEFLSEPWCKITIEEKIALEDELEKELGFPRGYNKEIWSQPNNHLLAQTGFSALAKNINTDEVIFSIHGKANGLIAIVHLTWSGKKEINSEFPITKLYQNLDEL